VVTTALAWSLSLALSTMFVFEHQHCLHMYGKSIQTRPPLSDFGVDRFFLVSFRPDIGKHSRGPRSDILHTEDQKIKVPHSPFSIPPPLPPHGPNISTLGMDAMRSLCEYSVIWVAHCGPHNGVRRGANKVFNLNTVPRDDTRCICCHCTRCLNQPILCIHLR